MSQPSPSTDGDVFTALMTPAARADPYPTYRQYRERRPIIDAGSGLWFVFSYSDCLTLLRHRNVSVDERNTGEPGDDLPTLIHLDPPDHTRLRRLVQLAFTPRRIESIRTRAEELVASTLDRFSAGDEVDVIAELAYPMPLTIICELLGVPPCDQPRIRELSAWMARSIDPGPMRSDELNANISRAQNEFELYMTDLVAEKRGRESDDLLGQLVRVELEGDRLSERELLGLAVLLVVAGHETTVGLIGNGLLALLQDDRQRAAATLDGADSRILIDELLRYDPPVQMTTRIALERIVIGSVSIPAGGVAVLLLGSANRDASVFDDPERLDVTTPRAHPHLAFGHGLHHCLGAALARAEAEVAISALLRRYPDVVALEEPALRPTFVLRGRETLTVRL